jgi:GMP synthase-like glutamine amidotransferase
VHFLVFQHVDVEHPGIYREFWREAGIAWTAIELDAGEAIPADLSGYDALVVMGGPMDVWQADQHPWLVPEIRAIRTFVRDLGKPFLGVCLGHQLLAAALDGECGLASAPEVGPWPVELTEAGAKDALFAGLSSPLTTFQWHGAEVSRLPPGAVVLAQTPLCRVQAMRWGAHAWGMQFHSEITAETVDDWRSIPEYAQSLEATLGPGASDRLAEETLALLPTYEAAARRFNDNFVAAVRRHAAGAARSAA